MSEEIAVVLGTRPEIIKMAPVVRAIEETPSLSLRLIHTDQHYDQELSGSFFEVLELPNPDDHLEVGSGTQGEQTATGLVGIESLLVDREPAAVLAQGDTNAVLSTALAASKLPVLFGHLEAGIRSFDESMPEEINRIVADDVADLLFAPTDDAALNLRAEGIEDGVHVTGNTVVDACHEHASIAAEKSTIHEELGVTAGEYVVATIHRPFNIDDFDRLGTIIQQLSALHCDVVFSAHPRTQEALVRADIPVADTVYIIDPVDYLDFLALQSTARVIVTDSGGIQEEASVLDVPCVTVRPNTERPETIEAGVNTLVKPSDITATVNQLIQDDAAHEVMTGYPDLYGDGESGARIVELVRDAI
jgi:UDP-N-acetylglucosamine 2-epimerase (non-hydrolysing)